MERPPPNTFGKRLAMLRDRKGLSQIELGRLVGKEQSTISAWESGWPEPRVSDLQQFCRIFDVSADFLLCRTPHEKPLPGESWIVDIEQMRRPVNEALLARRVPKKPLIVRDRHALNRAIGRMKARLEKRRYGRTHDAPP